MRRLVKLKAWERSKGESRRREDEVTRHSTRHVTDRGDRVTSSLSRPTVTAMPYAGSVQCHLSKACLHPQYGILVCLP